MSSGARDSRKSKFTASVTAKLVELLDEKVARLKLNRSDAIEEAIELWLKQQAEKEEEEYFIASADAMNEEARSWNSTTSASAQRIWDKHDSAE